MKGAGSTLAVMLALCGCAPNGHAPSADGGARPVNVQSIGGKRLDSLNEAQSEALCGEDARRYDPCIANGTVMSTAEECTATVDACHAAVSKSSGEFDCRQFDLGPSDECNVTVRDYLACVDAWNAVDVCDNAGLYIGTPDACRSVVTGCPRFARVFYRDGKPPPCDPSTAANPRPAVDVFHGYDGCRPIPKRFVILGDSIASCFAVSPDQCGPLLIAQHLKDMVAPDLTVEQHAVGGAFIADMPGQAAQVAGGAGHVAVWIHILGNDLALRHDDPDAWNAAFQTTFDYFTDTSRFPDGATFLLNTQYSPYDQCPDPVGGGISIPLSAERNLQRINDSLFIHLGEERPDTVTYDEYADWLGHGNNANVLGCPYCGADNTSWMSPDRIHPNAAGYAHVASRWDAELDRIYGNDCTVARDQ